MRSSTRSTSTAHEKRSIKDLTAECQLIKSYKEDATRMLENAAMATSTVKYVAKKKKPRSRQRDWKKNADKRVPQAPKQSSHLRSRNHGSRSYHMKSMIAALRKDLQPYLGDVINGRPLSLLLDMGAMITMISKSSWKRLGKPQLENSDIVISAANKSKIPTDRFFRMRMDSEGTRSP
ncbi:unnamed protein product [Heligmosomoides polygyrus]|uniref:Peptidase A2 domain-containing protein n=1 Tax=Heligmosomoides polygyrus TaxID=6339 RepID=A0A183G6G2_HELPZ|nr:unnamed protein product [Heligmosomoides polygyrus]